MPTILTLDLKTILKRLLQGNPNLAVWINFTNIHIDKAPLPGEYLTELVIDCLYPSLAKLFLQNLLQLQDCLQPVAIGVSLYSQGDFVVSWENVGLKLLQSIESNMNTTATLDTDKDSRETVTTASQQTAIDLSVLPESIKTFVLKQVAELHLPVFLKPDGKGYDLPETSFDIAWQNFGEFLKTGVPAFTEGKAPISGLENGTSQAAKTGGIPPRLMKQKFTGALIKQGKNGIATTLKVFLSKLNMKDRTEAEVWSAIANPTTEYGQQLMEKLREAYLEKSPTMTEKSWNDLSAKISAAATQMLISPQETTESED